MSLYLSDPDVQLYQGDALEVLRTLPDESVHCVATSPPFYALRDYGTGRWEGGDEGCDHKPRKFTEGCIGCGVPMESETPGCSHCSDRMLKREIRGTGDRRYEERDPTRPDLPNPPASWSTRDVTEKPSTVCGKCGAVRIDQQIGLEATPEEWAQRLVDVFREARRVLRKDGTLWVECGDSYNSIGGTVGGGKHEEDRQRTLRGWAGGLKPKDLLGTPWLLAFALRADGWWLRGCNIWAKPNAMPESAKDRCTTAHSYVFQLSRSARYFFDGDAISEDFSPNTHSAGRNKAPGADDSGKAIRSRYNDDFAASIPLRHVDKARLRPQDETLDGSNGEAPRGPDGRRVTHVEKGENSIQHRNGERWPNDGKHPRSVWTIPTQGFPEAHFATWPEALARRIILASVPEDGTVLDPFAGSGTTLYVARKLGRRGIGIDLNPEYLEMAARRLQQQSLFAETA